MNREVNPTPHTTPKPKKKRRNTDQWCKNKVKKASNSGQEYKSPRSGKVIPKKGPLNEVSR